MGARFSIKPIGYVENSVQDTRYHDWDTLVSRLVIEDAYTKALHGLEEFSHLLVIFWLHLPGKLLLKRHPRGRKDLPLVGIFATRTQFRPNPLGLRVVKLINVEGNTLLVEGLDAVHGTPLIDIKPYMPQRDTVSHARVPAWARMLDEKRT
jgi:tRNA (adenine37-N6)-methyltransferase